MIKAYISLVYLRVTTSQSNGYQFHIFRAHFLSDTFQYFGLNYAMSSTTSCENRCNHHDERTCKCDAECEIFGDCCVDFKTHCHVDLEDYASLHDAVYQKNLSVCTTVYNNDNAEVGYMLSECPSSWTEPIIRSRCSSHSINMHVYDINGYNYRNIYCALCYNHTLADISFWDVDDKLDLVDGCPIDVFDVVDDMKKQTLPIRGGIFRRCFERDRCNETFSNLTIINACSSYVYPLFDCLASPHTLYRNPHCVLCMHVRSNFKLRFRPNCQRDGQDGGGGFLAQDMWDFRTPEKTIVLSTIRCALGEVEDPVLDTCRPITCATGFALLAGKCVLDNNTQSVGHISSWECDKLVTLIIFRGHQTALTCVDDELKRNVEDNLYQPLTYKHQAAPGDDMWIAFKLTNESARKTLQTVRNGSHLNKFILRHVLDNCDINEIELISLCSLEPDECSGQWISGSPSDFQRISELENITDLYLKDTIYFRADRIIYILNYYSQHRKYDEYEVMLFCAHIIDSPFLDCPMITLSRKEYYLNKSSLYYGYIKFETNEYVVLPNGDAHICSRGIENQPKPSSKYSESYRFVIGALDAVHFTFSCLSIMSLFGTLVTYVKFKQLRNVQGIGIMCLSLALLFANIFTVLSEKIPLSGSVCIAFAAITHYFWLAAFTWMTSISSILIDTFVVNLTKPIRKNKTAICMLLLTGWGTPFLIILLLLFLHFCESCFTSDIIIYDGDSTCWLATPMINLYAFGVPVVFSLTINLVLIMITLISLRKARQESNQLQQKRKNEDAWKEALILLKVSC